MAKRVPLEDEDRKIYEWQLWVNDFGEEGQEKLKGSTVLVSRTGGLGGVAAYELAAAGVGRLILAHRGNIKPSDLHRQLLMTYDKLGTSRVECGVQRLKELNPRIEIQGIPENMNEENAESIISEVDVIVDCAPLFEERFAMNKAAIKYNVPLVECAMYDLEARITTVIPGQTPCVQCLHPETPPQWKRQFPVFGAVSGTVGCMGAMEAIKLIAGLGEPLAGKLLLFELRHMTFQTIQLQRNPDCPACSHLFLTKEA